MAVAAWPLLAPSHSRGFKWRDGPSRPYQLSLIPECARQIRCLTLNLGWNRVEQGPVESFLHCYNSDPERRADTEPVANRRVAEAVRPRGFHAEGWRQYHRRAGGCGQRSLGARYAAGRLIWYGSAAWNFRRAYLQRCSRFAETVRGEERKQKRHD